MAGVTSPPTVTGDDGRAMARFVANVRGWQDVTASISQVPDHRLHLLPAERDSQASAAQGGVAARSPSRDAPPYEDRRHWA